MGKDGSSDTSVSSHLGNAVWDACLEWPGFVCIHGVCVLHKHMLALQCCVSSAQCRKESCE